MTLAIYTGCGASQSTPTQGTAGKVYVANSPFAGLDFLLRFNAGNSGNVAPELKMQVTQQAGTSYLALDVPHDRIAAFSGQSQSVLFFEGVSGKSCCPATRLLSGPSTALTFVQMGTIDSPKDLLYVVIFPSTVLVFGPASIVSGDVPPLSSLTAAFTISGITATLADRKCRLHQDVSQTVMKLAADDTGCYRVKNVSYKLT